MMKEEYLEVSSGFREEMSAKDSNDFTEEDMENWLTWTVLSTCHTEGCRVEGVTFEGFIAEPLDGVYRMICGMCCNTIEDIDPMLEDDDEFRLNVRLPDGSFGAWRTGGPNE